MSNRVRKSNYWNYKMSWALDSEVQLFQWNTPSQLPPLWNEDNNTYDMSLLWRVSNLVPWITAGTQHTWSFCLFPEYKVAVTKQSVRSKQRPGNPALSWHSTACWRGKDTWTLSKVTGYTGRAVTASWECALAKPVSWQNPKHNGMTFLIMMLLKC